MLGYIITDKKTINVDEHEIFSFDILNKTNLNIFVVENNKILYHKLGHKLKYNKKFINVASMYGHVKVLEWFKNSGYKFKYDVNAILWASFNDHVDVIKWFEYLGLKIKYNFTSIYWASSYDHYEILRWFENRNVKKVIMKSHKYNITHIKFKTKNNYIKGYNKN